MALCISGLIILFLSGISCFFNLFWVLSFSGFFFFFGGWGGAGVIDSSYQEMSVLRFHSFFFAKTTQIVVELAEDKQTFSDTGKSLVNWIL